MSKYNDDEVEEVSVSYDDVVNFVDASSTLAAELEHAIAAGLDVPNDLVLALNNYKIKAASLQNVLDFVESSKVSLN